MAMVINSNIMSLNAQNNLSKSQNELNTSIERLSSGKRINSAADDAAGLAIASRMTSQIRGLEQATRNANDGISLIQTAEGALDESLNIVQRMRELAIQSANGTYDSGNRATLNAEVSQLKLELSRIAETTTFAGNSILDGSLSEFSLQVGSEANQTIDFSISAVDADTLGIADTAGLSSLSTSATGASAATAAANLNSLGTGDLIINGISIDSASASDDTASSVGKSSSAIATAAAINEKSSETGVVAVVNETTLGGVDASGMAAGQGTLTINGVKIDIGTTGDAESSIAAVAAAINAKTGQTGVVAEFSGIATDGINLVAEDGRNIAVELLSVDGLDSDDIGIDVSGGTTAAGAIDKVVVGSVTLISQDGTEIDIDSAAEGSASVVGFKEGTYSGSFAQIASDLSDSTAAMAVGDLVINGVSIGASLESYDTASTANADASAISKAAAINEVADQTGVSAVALENIVSNSTAQSAGTGAVAATINGVSITGFTATGDTTQDRATFVDQVNAISERTGVIAIDTGEDGTANGGGVQLVAADGRNIVLSTMTGAAQVGVAAADTYVGEFVLQSDSEIVISAGTGTIANSGLKVGSYGGGESGQSISNIDISTVDGANKALFAIDNALERISEIRGDLGAISNRLDFTINNLTNVTENLAAARSRIEDADFAKESAALSRAQILQQAGTAMLAQANAQPQQVLSLLQ